MVSELREYIVGIVCEEEGRNDGKQKRYASKFESIFMRTLKDLADSFLEQSIPHLLSKHCSKVLKNLRFRTASYETEQTKN